MKSFKARFTSLALVVLLLIQPAHAEKIRALFGDGSVRYASAGMIGLNSTQGILIGLLLPAVQRARANIKIVDSDGDTLFTKTVGIPQGFDKDLFGLNFKITTDDKGIIAINDGTTQEVIGDITTSEHVGILIGLLLPAVQKVRDPVNRQHVGSVQIFDKRTGAIDAILPFIEQSVLAKAVTISAR